MIPAAADQDIFLCPGELWFGGDRARVATVLGSCVAITVWHPTRRIGGMCHFMLPEPAPVQPSDDARYAGNAVARLLEHIKAHGGHPAEFEAKLIGGGNMFEAVDAPAAVRPVSARNTEAARGLARAAGLRVVAEHLGGSGHRHVVFDLGTGNAWVRHVPLARAPGRR